MGDLRTEFTRMSTRVQSRRPTKRRATERARSHGKLVILDLNNYPEEYPASSWFCVGTSDTSVILPSQAIATQRNATCQVTAPIDVDAIEDDIVFLSSSSEDAQMPNLPRRTTPIIDIPDEDTDPHEDSSEVSAIQTLVDFSNNDYRVHSNPTLRNFINCDAYGSSLCSDKTYEKIEVVVSSPEPQIVPPKQHDFNCAICLSQLVNESSTTCGHIFCEECIKMAIKAQKRCPTCRKSLTMKKIHRVYLPVSN